MITWNKQTSDWFTDASIYTGFHKSLAQKIKPHLAQSDTLCDIGCGLGRLDLELSPHVAEILAIDVSDYATKTLEQTAKLHNIKNLRVRKDNAEELDGVYDIILMSLYVPPDIKSLLDHCRRHLIRIVSAGRKSGLYPERHRRDIKNAVPVAQAELASLGIKYSYEPCSLEFGQPLKTWRDAEQFVLSNAPEAAAGEVTDFLQKNIHHTPRPDFPYYLPYKKELGIFIITP